MTFQKIHSVGLFAVAAVAFAALGFAAAGGQTPPVAQTPDVEQARSTVPPAGSDSGTATGTADGDDRKKREVATRRLLIAQIVLIALVLVALPAGAWINSRGEPAEKRGLGLPRGSVRAMLALLIVGSSINLLVFGSALADLAAIIGTLNTLTAAVIGFYFGGRTSAPKPKNNSG